MKLKYNKYLYYSIRAQQLGGSTVSEDFKVPDKYVGLGDFLLFISSFLIF